MCSSINNSSTHAAIYKRIIVVDKWLYKESKEICQDERAHFKMLLPLLEHMLTVVYDGCNIYNEHNMKYAEDNMAQDVLVSQMEKMINTFESKRSLLF